ncbi:hypothetical protein [Geodermatophilus sp. Leaf369]|uniref:hypothetical protein n=1 Tax=Geodermatophilus sp. Leaf369 TaxID=1736354 RepID=UPI0012F7DE74|nr:hypothetical protein [Geodermatophilus sp. Leaf369]
MSEDPRAAFRTLPGPVHPDELVETSAAPPAVPVPDEGELERAWRTVLLGAGG